MRYTEDEIRSMHPCYFVGKKRDCRAMKVLFEGRIIRYEDVTYTWEQFDSENIVAAMKSIQAKLDKESVQA